MQIITKRFQVVMKHLGVLLKDTNLHGL